MSERPISMSTSSARRARRGALLHVVVLGLILLLAIGLRWSAATEWNRIRPHSAARLVGDEPQYDNLARSLLAGRGFDWPGRTPLYPAWLAVVYWASDGSYAVVPYTQIGWGLLTTALTYWLGRRLFGPWTGALAALLVAGSYTLIHQSLHLLTEILFAPALLSIVLALMWAAQRPSARRFAWLGFTIGVCNLIRPTLVLFPLFLLPLLLLMLGRRNLLRWWGACAIVSVLTVTPWLVHNYVRHRVFFALLAPSNAILWQGSPEYYHLLRDQGYTYMRVWSEVLYGPNWQAHDPMSMAGDRWWTARALRSIAAEPQVYLRYAAEKTATLWIGDPEADWNGSSVFDYRALRDIGFGAKDARLVMVMRGLPILALLAIIVLRRAWRAMLPIYGLLLYVTLLHAATHAEARLSEPFQPLLLVLIAGAAVRLLPWARTVGLQLARKASSHRISGQAAR